MPLTILAIAMGLLIYINILYNIYWDESSSATFTHQIGDANILLYKISNVVAKYSSNIIWWKQVYQINEISTKNNFMTISYLVCNTLYTKIKPLMINL